MGKKIKKKIITFFFPTGTGKRHGKTEGLAEVLGASQTKCKTEWEEGGWEQILAIHP